MFALASGVKLGLWARDNVEPKVTGANGGSELGFPVADGGAVDRIHADWRTRGIAIAQAPSTMDFGRTFVALDPDGHRLRYLLRWRHETALDRRRVRGACATRPRGRLHSGLPWQTGTSATAQPGDGVVCYSPAETLGGKGRLQAFTSVGTIKDDNVYQADMGGGFAPFRRDVTYRDARATPIAPLLDELADQGYPQLGSAAPVRARGNHTRRFRFDRTGNDGGT